MNIAQALFLIALGTVLIGSPAQVAANAREEKVCSDIRGNADYHHRVFGEKDDLGTIFYHNLKFDRESSVKANLFCGDGASIIPADPCELKLDFPSGVQLSLEKDLISIVEYDSRFYIVWHTVENSRGTYTVDSGAYIVSSKKFMNVCGRIRSTINTVH